MAGIEKICEFSGDYPGWKMYGYKRNHIQICPEYRKLFRGATAHIEIIEVEPQYVFKFGGYTDIDYLEWGAGSAGRIQNQYTFALVVDNPELKGEVNGRYINWTFNMRQTVKRLKRMLRVRNIKIVHKERNRTV